MNDSKSLADKVAVVTGGGHGIGAAIATKLAEIGANVVICGRSRPPLDAMADRIRQAGHQCMAEQCDVTDLRSVEALAAKVQKDFGRIDILVNNAGVGGFGGPLHTLPPDVWDRVLNTN